MGDVVFDVVIAGLAYVALAILLGGFISSIWSTKTFSEKGL